MNKAELIARVASSADISKAAAGRAVEAVAGAITTSLKASARASLPGVGVFSVEQMASRATDRTPVSKVVKFRASKSFTSRLGA